LIDDERANVSIFRGGACMGVNVWHAPLVVRQADRFLASPFDCLTPTPTHARTYTQHVPGAMQGAGVGTSVDVDPSTGSLNVGQVRKGKASLNSCVLCVDVGKAG
jgi:hypothetical protein